MKKIKIGNKFIGENEPTFIIAEMGINHNGDIEIAKKMVDVAVECGADAVKTQKRNVKDVFVPEVLNAPRGEGTYYDYKEGIELSKEEFRTLASYCKKKGIIFLASAWDYDSIELLEEIGVPAHKISSALLTDFPYVDYIAKKKKPVLLSTGMSTMKEIEEAVEIIKRHTDEIVLLQCTSTYPSKHEQINLRVMKTLRDKFNLPVGFSGHEYGIMISEAAAALGAVVIERHFTLDRAMPGSDQAASLEPRGLSTLIRDIRVIEKALGSPEKVILEEEYPIREKLSKSVVAKVDISKGKKITKDMLTTKSPGTGLSPKFIYNLYNKKAKKDIQKDSFVMLDDVE